MDAGTPIDGATPPDGGGLSLDAAALADGSALPDDDAATTLPDAATLLDAGTPVSSCDAVDLGSALGMRIVSGELAESVGAIAAASCAYGGPTRRSLFAWTPPATGRYSAYLYFYSPTILTVREGCSGSELGCAVGLGDTPGASFDALAGHTYLIGVQSANPDDRIDEDVDFWELNIVPYVPETECSNRDDDDYDGLLDCRDPDCALDPACDLPPPPCTRVCAPDSVCVNCPGWGELCLPSSDPRCGLPPA